MASDRVESSITQPCFQIVDSGRVLTRVAVALNQKPFDSIECVKIRALKYCILGALDVTLEQ
jgi:hypothetical protein